MMTQHLKQCQISPTRICDICASISLEPGWSSLWP